MAKKKEVATKVDLDSIKVMPGEFYLNAHGNLGYFHQISVPGKAIDAFLKELAPVVADLLLEPLELAGWLWTWHGLFLLVWQFHVARSTSVPSFPAS